jgi:hypothetical protein
MSTEALEARLNKLETALKRWRRFSGITALVAVASLTLAAYSLRPRSELRLTGKDHNGNYAILSASELTFWNRAGKPMAQLGIGRGDMAELAIYGAEGGVIEAKGYSAAPTIRVSQGNRSALLTAHKFAAELELSDENTMVKLDARTELGASLMMSGDSDQGIVAHTHAGTVPPRIQLHNGRLDGGGYAVLEADGKRGSTMQLSDATGSRTVSSKTP